jgi:hypothetical protein
MKPSACMVRPLTVIVEVAGPCQLKPGYFCGDFYDGRFKRAWWLWVAIAWVRMDLPTYNRHIKTGLTEWRDSIRPNGKPSCGGEHEI